MMEKGIGADVALICFDVDGTLIVHPQNKVVWEVLNSYFGTPEEINADRYRRFKEGTLSYREWIALDVGDWMKVGATRDEIVRAIQVLSPVLGAVEALHTLKDRGYRLGVISGTIDVVLDHFFPEHPFQEIFTNQLRFDSDERVSGWKATPFDMHGKAEALRGMADREGLTLEQCAFVGDHFNDVEVAKIAGFAIAFNPKSNDLEKVADVSLHSPDLRDILTYFPAKDS